MSRNSRFNRKMRSIVGFTLIELIASTLVIAILSALVVSTYQSVKERSRDRVAMLQMQTLSRSAMSVYQITNGAGGWVAAYQTAAQDVLFTTASEEGVLAEQRNPQIKVDDRTKQISEQYGPSDSPFIVSIATGTFNGEPAVGVATTSPSGNCVMSVTSSIIVIDSWNLGKDVGSACGGSVALQGQPEDVATIEYAPVSAWGVPMAPAGLAGIVTQGQIDLSWTASTSAGVSSYNLYRNGELLTNTASTSYIDTTVADATNYAYEVASLNSADIESPKAPAYTTASLPGGLADCVAAPSDSQITLTWSPSAGVITGYKVTANGATTTVLGASSSSYVVTGLENGTGYPVSVVAFNASGNGAVGTACSSTQTPIVVPGMPAGTTAAADAPGTITLNWDAVTGTAAAPVSGYRVYQKSAITGLFEIVAATTDTTYAATGLTNGTSYEFQVASYGAAGESGRAAVDARAIDTPVAPSISTVSYADGGDVTLSFTIPTSTARPAVTVQYLVGSDVVATGSSDDTSYTFENLTSGQGYTVAVRVKNSAGNVTESRAITAVSIPSTPNGLTATAADTQVLLAWNEVSSTASKPVTGYRVYQLSAVTGLYELLAATSVESYVASGLTNGTEYSFKVAAYGTAGEAPRTTASSATPIGTPAIATNLSLTAGDETSALTWTTPVSTDAAPVTSLEIYRDTTKVATLDADATTYTFTGLNAGTEYTFKVTSKNAVASATASTTFTAVTLPAAPTNFAAAAETSKVKLTWTAVTSTTAAPITGYRVYQLNETSGLYELAGATSGTTLTVSGLDNGTEYSFKVATYGTAGEGLRSSTEAATPLAAPATITTLTPTIGDKTASITWDAAVSTTAAPVTGVQVLLDGDVVATLGATATSYTYENLTEGTEYTLGVRPKNGVANGTATTTTLTAVTLPDAPAGVTAAAGTSEVALNWDAVTSTTAAPVAGYRVYQLNETSGLYELAGATSGTSITISGLTNGTEYSFKVAAYGTAGEGLRSATATSTPLAAPAAITSLNPSYGDLTVSFTWDAAVSTTAAPVTGLELLRDGVVVKSLAATATSYTYTSLTAGTEYEFSIRAKNGVATGTATSSTLTAVELPAAPANVTATAGTSQAALDWDAVASTTAAPVAGYRVYQLNETSGLYELAGAFTSTSGTISGLTNGTEYSFKVAAYGTAGEGLRSTTATVTPLAAPAAIADVTSAYGDKSVVLNWTSATSTTAAPVSALEALVNGTVVGTLGATATTYTFSGLTAGTEYTLAVRPKNAVATGEATSATLTAITVPAAPTDLAIAQNGVTKFRLTWTTASSTSSAPITGYNVYISPAGANNYTLAGSTASGALDINSGLTAGSAYDFVVASYNSGAESVRTSSVSMTAYNAPAAITDATVTVAQNTATPTLTVTWPAVVSTAAAPVTSIQVRSEPAGCASGSLAASATSYTCAGLTNATEYTMVITTFNAAVQVQVQTGPVTAYGLPTAPTSASTEVIAGTTVSSTGTLRVNFTPASAASNLTGYQVVDGSGTLMAAGASSPIDVTGLDNGTAYTLSVRSYGPGGASSAAAAGTTTPYRVPSAPTGVSVTANQDTTFTVVFTPGSNGGSAQSFTANCTNGSNTVSGTGSSSPITTGVANAVGSTYTCSVTAANAAGSTTSAVSGGTTSAYTQYSYYNYYGYYNAYGYYNPYSFYAAYGYYNPYSYYNAYGYVNTR